MKALHQGYTTTPTQNIQPDWDVQLVIEETLQELNITLKKHHLYGHQDTRNRPNSMEDKTKGTNQKGRKIEKNKTKRKRLTWEAHLNTKADILATRAHNMLQKKKNIKIYFIT
eukprot:10288053-Ditylum_brightwellii.AAC.1